MHHKLRILLLLIGFISFFSDSYSQGCCSGGSGSPLAGGNLVGVLAQQQMEISSNFQYLKSSMFLNEDKDATKFFDHFSSRYLYSRIGYGLTKNFTMSVEMGYFPNKTQVGLFDTVLGKSEIIKSSGVSDLILFPKYEVFNRSDSNRKIELALGLGYKLPLGKYKDSTLVYTNPNSGQQFYTTSPPLVQPTTGSQDIIGYLFFMRGFPKHNFKLFTNAFYIRKGWNSIGEKFGDYSSVGLFASKTFFDCLGVTLQVKGERIGKLKAADNVDLLAFYNVDTASTGSKKISFSPQISYNYRSLTLFALADIPLYEYVYGTQVASQHQFTFGISYRFFTTKNPVCEIPSAEDYQCSMRCEGGGSNSPGKCKVCGMKLYKVK